MKKYYLSVIIVFLTLIGLSACSSKSKDTILALEFSQYYQNADDYEKIQPLMTKYFSCIQNAFDESDKSNLNTFILSDEYKEASNSLSEISNDNSGSVVNGETNISKEYLARLQLLEPYLRMEYYLAQKDLLLKGNGNSNVALNKDWFSEVKGFLTNTYSEFENGTGN